MINILQTKFFLLRDVLFFIGYKKLFELRVKLLVLIYMLITKKNDFILTIYLRKRFVNVFYYILKKTN